MEFFYRKALTDFNKSLEKRPSLTHPYSYMIRIAARVSATEHKRVYVDKAIKNNPYTILPRQYYLRMLTPRWGGSLEEMEAFCEETKPYFAKHPGLEIIKAEIDIEIGDQAYAEGRFEKAVELYSAALSRGDSPYAFLHRGMSYKKLNRHDAAIFDFDKAISLNPSYESAYEHRINSNYGKKNAAGIFNDANQLIELNPRAKFYYMRGSILTRYMDRHDESIEDLKEAVRLDPRDAAYKKELSIGYERRGFSYMKKGGDNLALADFDKAIELNSKSATAFYYKGYIFANKRLLKEAIDNYDQAIRLNPEFKNAYLHRGYVLGKMNERTKSCADWKKACDLGACETYEKAKSSKYCTES